jgi:hypothetical protein
MSSFSGLPLLLLVVQTFLLSLSRAADNFQEHFTGFRTLFLELVIVEKSLTPTRWRLTVGQPALLLLNQLPRRSMRHLLNYAERFSSSAM